MGPTLVMVVSTTRNQRPAIRSLMFRLIIRPLARSYFLYSCSSRQNSFTRVWPLTDRVSFRMPLISSLHSWASRVRVHRRWPAFLVGMVNRGTMMMPTVARIQFFRYMAISATARVMEFDRMLE